MLTSENDSSLERGDKGKEQQYIYLLKDHHFYGLTS